jgi:hypothetical protein
MWSLSGSTLMLTAQPQSLGRWSMRAAWVWNGSLSRSPYRTSSMMPPWKF